MPRLTLALLALVATLATTVRAASPAQLEFRGEGATITLTAPGAGDPVAPGEPATLRIAVTAPADVAATVTIQADLSLAAPAAACRPVDAPDPEYAGWLVCGNAPGPWQLELNIPTANIPTANCQLVTVPIPVSVGVEVDDAQRRLGGGVIAAALLPCYRVTLPAL